MSLLGKKSGERWRFLVCGIVERKGAWAMVDGGAVQKAHLSEKKVKCGFD